MLKVMGCLWKIPSSSISHAKPVLESVFTETTGGMGKGYRADAVVVDWYIYVVYILEWGVIRWINMFVQISPLCYQETCLCLRIIPYCISVSLSHRNLYDCMRKKHILDWVIFFAIKLRFLTTCSSELSGQFLNFIPHEHLLTDKSLMAHIASRKTQGQKWLQPTYCLERQLPQFVSNFLQR